MLILTLNYATALHGACRNSMLQVMHLSQGLTLWPFRITVVRLLTEYTLFINRNTKESSGSSRLLEH
jgi:hypothetical protein